MQEQVVTPEMRSIIQSYARPDLRKGIWQLVNTVLPCLGLWALTFYSLRFSYWVTLGLSVLTAAFLVRTFIIFHDCGHGSFMRSRRANQIIGFFTGILTLTPHHRWWADHSRHHATTGNLDRYGIGDVWMLTVDDYARAHWLKKIWYRTYRHPFFMFVVGPFFIFALIHRIPRKGSPRSENMSVIWTDLVLVIIWTAFAFTIGLKSYLMVHVPILGFSGMAGLWLFYVQHNYEHAYWKKTDEHDPAAAALLGSSYFKLPGVLQWFSGNIGFHHIHHLSPRVPNYSLESCYRSLPNIPEVTTLGLRTSLRSLSLRLWDDANQRMISFGEYQNRQKTA
jgi:omega-6 fatty acid desaturase (delta-12 desaturase)